MELKQIKPKLNGKSDKYSWQLYQFLKKHKYSLDRTKVIFDTLSRWDGSELKLDYDNLKKMQIWIGMLSSDNWFYGNTLNLILGSSRQKYERWANPWLMQHKTIDITEWFWNEYIENGRCIWDREHDGWLMDDNERFTYSDDIRICNWCGEKQSKLVKEITEIKIVESWVNI